MKKYMVAFGLLLALATSVGAQSVQQSGTITPNHIVNWVTNGVIGDGGTANDSPISSLGVTNNTTAGLCISSGRASAAGRQQMCFGAPLNAPAQITVQNYGTATPKGFQFVIDGVTTVIPGGGIYTTLAIKNPVDAATTGNITLSGEQTIDGFVTSASRILVWQQTVDSQNGIYTSSSGAWTRATDFNTTGQVSQGTQVYVNAGTVNGHRTLAVSTANPITIGTSAINFIFNNWYNLSNFTSINAAVTSLGGTTATLLCNTATTLSASLNVPANITLNAQKGCSITKASTYTLTLNGQVQAGRYQIFSGFSSGDVTNTVASTLFPEWFGAVADGNLSNATGTDNRTAINATIQAVPSGYAGSQISFACGIYNISDYVTLNKNRVALDGCGGDSTLIQVTSAGGTGIVVTGISAAHIISPQLNNLYFLRATGVTPTGGVGIELVYATLTKMLNVRTENFLIGIYQTGAPNTIIENALATYTFATSSVSGVVYDGGLSAADGNASSVCLNCWVDISATNGSGGGRGIWLKGVYLADIILDKAQIAGGATGIDVDLTASTPSLAYADDILIISPITDQFTGQGINITGPTTNEGMLTISGGWSNPAATGAATQNVKITSGNNVTITGHQFYNIANFNGLAAAGVQIAAAGTGIKITNNTFVDMNLPIVGAALTDSVIGHNVITNNIGADANKAAIVALNLTGASTRNTITANTFSGVGNGAIQTAISLGASTSVNSLVSNTLRASPIITTALSDSGTGNIYFGNSGLSDTATQFTFTTEAAPGTPAAGKSVVYVDSTQKILSNKDDTGRVTVTVLPGNASANSFVSGVSASGGLNTAQPTIAGIAGLGTGAATALGTNVGTAGSFVVNGGALGTPSSGVLTNATGLPLTTGVTGILPIANTTTGTSGATLPLLDGNNTFSGSDVFTGGLNPSGATNAYSFVMTNSSVGKSLRFRMGALGQMQVIDDGITSVLLTLDQTGNFIAAGQYTSQSTADAASATDTTAAMNAAGGLSIAKKIWGGSTINVTGVTNVATTSALCYNTGTGLFSYDGTIGTCTVSDERLKNMGGRIPNALDRLLQINGVYYTWKDPSMGSGRQIGVGAQTVEKVFPELVQTDSAGRKSADYQRLTAPIIEALRELKADNDNLRREIARIKRRMR